MAIIEDYVDLMMQVADHVGRDDFAHYYDTHVRNAENAINDILRGGDQQVHTTLVFVDGEADLPDDFLEMLSIGIQGYAPLKASTLEAVGLYYEGGVPMRYAIKGDTIVTGPKYTGSIPIIYYRGVTALGLTGTNWLLERKPDAYLFGVAARVALMNKDMELAGTALDGMRGALATFTKNNLMKRFSNAKVRIGGLTP